MKDIDKYNPDYINKLGAGSIDAGLAVKSNKGIAPEQIKDLKVKGLAQEFATLEWTVPVDTDDGVPMSFEIYYSTENITSSNLNNAKKLELTNKSAVGETINFEINGLLGTTQYYFAVISLDRWGNKSVLSNVANGKTNNGPSIDVETGSADKSISLSADVAQSAIVNKNFQLLNKSEGILRWEYLVRNTGHNYSITGYSARTYPQVMSKPKGVVQKDAPAPVAIVRNTDVVPYAAGFTPIEKRYVDYASVYIGDTDPSIPTSGAVKFIVTEEAGFNLTQVKTTVQYTLGTGPLIIEVYKDAISKDKLCRVEEFQPQSVWNTSHVIPLKEHVYFEKGTEFYIVVHVPGGNGYSLGIGVERSAEYSDYCYFSSDYGATWALLTTVGISQSYAWDIAAVSQLPNVAEFITLDPASGSLEGNSEKAISLQANANTLINGTYQANVLFKSNDSKNGEFRMPAKFDVAGHKPEMIYPKVVDFGSVFKEAETSVDIILENVGYGLIKDLNVTTDNPQFTVETKPYSVEARSESSVRVKFKPTTTGNINGKLNITSGQYSYTISLFGVGAETSEIQITPTTQTISGITIGNDVESNVVIKNNGKFPLKYFIPGYDNQGVSNDWPTAYHTYGYVVRSNKADIGVDASLTYVYNDISTTGIDITRNYIDSRYSTIEIPFDFPYYGEIQDKIYITKNGFTTFDNTAQPYNTPKLKGDLKGYISLTGYDNGVDLTDGKVFYRAEADHLIIQYTNIKFNGEYFTGQIVLYANGNIRFYYKDVPTGFAGEALTILIEDVAQTDGILLRQQHDALVIANGTVIGFDYPGPNIITSIENGSGVIAPNEQTTVKVKMSTSSLVEGDITRNINVINNDPLHSTASFSTILNITAGGVEDYVLSSNEVDFGVIYQNYPYTQELKIRNKGSKALIISSLVFDNTKFNVEGSMTIKPGINEIFKITPTTTNVAELEDILTINFANGTTETVNLKASVRTVPVANADLTPITTTLELEEKKTYPFEIENTGGSDLEVSIIGGQWFGFEETTSTQIKKYDYHVKKENSGQPSYNWLNIIPDGNKIVYDYTKEGDKTVFWTDVELPFTFAFYGTAYQKIKIGYNGIVALGGDPEAMPFPQGSIPIEDANTAFICPLWSPGGYDTYNHPEDAGIYYKVYDDRIVISWMYFMNFFSWGQSAQAILFKDGTIKFQYKLTDGTSDGSASGIVGVQNTGGEDYTLISSRSNLQYGEGLAYLIMPDNVHAVPANEKIQGNLVLDATNIYGGSFSDNLLIKSNDPANPELLKPLSVDVAGTALADAPAEIDLGDTEVVFDEDNFSYKYIMKPLVVKNTGTAPFRVLSAKMETGGKYLTQMVLVPGFLGAQWTPIEQVGNNFPQQLLLPGASYNTYVRFAPQVAGTYEDVLILTTTIGEIRIKLKGFGYDAPVINVDKTPINVSFNTMDQKETKSVKFDNKEGGYKLDYEVFVKYRRGLNLETKEKLATSRKALAAKSSLVTTFNQFTPKAIKPLAEEFENKIQYVNEYNGIFGQVGYSATLVSTRFVAGKEGFTLSDVGTILAIDKGTSGTINIEVRVGGDDITNALPVATKDFEFAYPEEATAEYVVVDTCIRLDNPVQILPNEEFYVIYDYPMELIRPQTIQIGGVDINPGRYWFFAEGEWFKLEDYLSLAGADPNSGYLMYVCERENKESGWVKILTPAIGTLEKGAETKADIEFVASFADRGDQKANLVIKSTDVNASVVEVPISLHVNQAPEFIDTPTSIITSENEVSDLTVVVKDRENNTFDFVVVSKPEFVTSTENDDKSIKFSIAPDYGDAGKYSISMKATDQYNATSEHEIEVNVAKTNRAPQYTSDITILRYNLGATSEKMDINDLFADPDNDEFTFTVTSLDNSIIEAYQSGSAYFMVEPRKAGETKLSFVVTDTHNASTTHEINVVVENCISPETIIVQKWNNALVINNKDGQYISYQWFKNGVLIPGATKQYYGERDGELDFEAQYFVQLTTTDGKTVFTCPMTPEKKDISLKAYPNPVKAGQTVTVEAQLPDLVDNPLTIQVISLTGRVVKTLSTDQVENSIQMPDEAGSYLIKVSNGNISKTFNVIVQ